MSDPQEKDVVRADYIKSYQFRVVHADGVVGAVTPRGLIHFDVFSERKPIPQQVVYPIVGEGELGPEDRTQRLQRETDVIREVEVGVVMDADLTRAFIKFLQDRLVELDKLGSRHT